MSKKRSGLICAVIALIVPLVLLSFGFLLPPQYNETYLAALQDKIYRLQTAKRPRIIVMGGSGAAFALRSDLLEREVPGYTVVNFGLYAGLGTAVMLDLAESYLQAGDVLVFMPEQNSQCLSAFLDAEKLWQALDGAAFPWLSLNHQDRSAALGAFPRFAAGKARLFFSGEKPAGDAIYARASLNEYGDMACPGRESNRMAIGCDPDTAVSFDPSLPTADFIDRVNAFAAACAKKGAALYFGFCPMNAAALSPEERDRMEAYTAALKNRLACPILGTPEEAVMEAGWFFDTNFHLNASGQIAFTARLAGQIKEILGDSSPVSIAVPNMPSLAEAVLWEGDQRDEACFLYEVTARGCTIIGLSEAGRGRAALTVPAVHDGRAVLTFDAAAFAGNEALETLTLGPNIASIPDGAFRGCAALTQIVLNNPAPETCAVGQSLLEGTNALVAVPQSAYSAYAANYFWSLYASRLTTF